MTRSEWLSSLGAGDSVVVRNGRSVHFGAEIDGESKTRVSIGTLRFRRKDGQLIRNKYSTQPVRAYRNMVLVRTETEAV
jgi:hypothetical protein